MISTENSSPAANFSDSLIDEAWLLEDEVELTVECESQNLASAGEIVVQEAALHTLLTMEDCKSFRVVNSNGRYGSNRRLSVNFR